MAIFKHVNTLKPFDWFLILGIVTTNVIYSILQKEIDFIGSIAAITGVICVVMVAKGNILNYVFGIINVSLYAWISYKAALYGDAVLNAFYYLPMQFIGWFSWMKRRESNDSVTVKTKQMDILQRLLLFFISVAFVVAGGFVLKYFNDPQPFKDSATTVLSVIAMFLMVKTFMEQWILWAVVNVISIVMWIFAFIRGDMHSMLMVIMWVFYLINSLNGWYTWYQLSRVEK